MTTPPSLTTPPDALQSRLRQAIQDEGGWIGFDAFMAQALYTPGLGYYAHDGAKFGVMPVGVKGQGSDFVTAPEMTPFFGRALAVQVVQALQVTGTHEVWEFGAGSGALALQLLQALGEQVHRYTIVDISGSLRAHQQQTLAAHGDKVRWVSELPQTLQGVVVGNEVLDAMPVKLLARAQGAWFERGVALRPGPNPGTGPGPAEMSGPGLVWQDRATDLRPPVEIAGGHDYVTEIHQQADGFVRTLGERLTRGAVFLIDYGFPEAEYYHAQRHMGTVMCHRAHLADTEPLLDVGLKDITAHVNFTGTALAAQDIPGFGVLGYATQARFLMNCGLLHLLEGASLQDRSMAQKLVMEHEMGELFKVIGFFKGEPWDAIGFAQGDRTHRL
ncbi:MAG: hypothetical protein RIS34_1101 [Pseudomonadota bacterium]|jgi:SAM-dependent MidA family methyltransferase